jgi:DNA-directed RNA polymerase subunit RPC12/RpoP
MSDLISRQAAIEAVIKRDANCGVDSAEVLKALPSAQPLTAYVIRDEDGNIKCSNCGSHECWGNYCMNCGAQMGRMKNERL